MKQYTKPLPEATHHAVETVDLQGIGRGKAAKRGTAGGLSLGGSSQTHISTTPIHDVDDVLNDFLQNAFNEWEKWLNDYELRASQRAYRYRLPFTPTDVSKLFPLTASWNKEATTDYDATN